MPTLFLENYSGEKKMTLLDPIFPSYICMNWMNHVNVWHVHCNHFSMRLLFEKLLIHVTFASILANVFFQLSTFFCICMPRLFSGPNKVFAAREWNVLVQLAQGRCLTFTHIHSTRKHVMCLIVFRWKWLLTRFGWITREKQ